MKKISIILIMTIVLYNISACQPTPKEPVVISKSGDEFESKIYADALPEYDYTSIMDGDDVNGWSEEFLVDNMHCYINADIILPESTYLPVCLIETGEFDVQEANEILSHFIRDAEGVREPYLTKEELTIQLIAAKRGEPKYDYENDAFVYEPYEGQQEQIDYLTQQISESHPEIFEKDGFEIQTLTAEKVYKIDNNARRYIHAEKDTFFVTEFNPYYSVIQLQSWIEDDASVYEPNGFIVQPEISENSAAEQAQELLCSIGLNNTKIAYTEPARVANMYTSEIVSQGWMVITSNNYGKGVPVDLISLRTSGLLNFAQTEYNERWRPESISVYVDGSGVRMFCWEDPVDVVEVLNTNVEILNFSEIKESIRKAVRFGCSQTYFTETKDNYVILTIDKITLSNIAVPVKDSIEYDVLIPAWLVTYNYKVGDVEGLESIFAINAIDGSIIDLELRTGP